MTGDEAPEAGRVTGDEAPNAVDRPPLLGNWLSILSKQLESDGRVALCLDFDGTLAPIVDDPDGAYVPERSRDTLEQLADCPNVDVAVVSGRGLVDLSSRLDIDGCTLAGDHGLEMETGDGRWVHPTVAEHRDALERAIEAVELRIEPIDGCHLEDKTLSATVHHRRADVDADAVYELVSSVVSEAEGVEASRGRQIVEIRPDVDWDKGDAVRQFVDDHEAVLFVGDDVTDEDAFEAIADLPMGSVGILVGDRPSMADVRVHDPDGVRAFLEWLLEAIPVEGVPASEADTQQPST